MMRFSSLAGAITIALSLGVPAVWVANAQEVEHIAPVLRDMRPVTDEMLARPSADSWLHWGASAINCCCSTPISF